MLLTIRCTIFMFSSTLDVLRHLLSIETGGQQERRLPIINVVLSSAAQLQSVILQKMKWDISERVYTEFNVILNPLCKHCSSRDWKVHWHLDHSIFKKVKKLLWLRYISRYQVQCDPSPLSSRDQAAVVYKKMYRILRIIDYRIDYSNRWVTCDF